MRPESLKTIVGRRAGRQSAPVPLLVCMATLAALALLDGSCLFGAESGTIHRGVGAGVRMDVDSRWLSGPACRPVRITITPMVPAVADRTFTVEFSITSYPNYGREDLRVVQDIEIPAGSSAIETTISIPQTAAWTGYTMTVLEDGEVLPRLSSPGGGDQSYAWAWGDKFPKILIVADKLPDTSAVAGLMNVSEYYEYHSGRGRSGGNAAPLPTAMARPAAELPQRWIDYTNLDVVCLSCKELAGLAEQRPEAFEAILQWTFAGGNLCVYGVGREWDRLAEMESLVGFAPGPDGDPVARGWIEPRERLFGRPLRGMGPGVTGPDFVAVFVEGADEVDVDTSDMGGMGGPAEGEEASENAESEPPREPADPETRLRFVFRQVNMGMIVAVGDEDPFTDPAAWGARGWSWMLNCLGSKRFLWYQRFGMSGVRKNGDFWDFLIPGVGLAPIMAFRILITLFVLFIGPVNYWLLRRWRSLHLLVVTVPLSAAVVTVAIFAYALVADGLGTRVRARSFTRIDQRRGQAACWARLSYYTGLAPVGGLRFPSDVVVIPMKPVPADRRTRTRELIWEEDQWLSSGWLPARTPTQMIAVRSRASALGLSVTETEATPGVVQVANRLGTPIRQLVVRSKGGQYFRAADVAIDRTVEAEAAELVDVQAWLEETFRECDPSFPVGMDRPGQTGASGWGNSRAGWQWAFDRVDIPASSQKTGLLEMSLAAGRIGRLEPGSYLAIVDRSPEVVMGVSSAREEASLHVILGNW